MPTTETSDPQLHLKKKARRRLVGAVAIAGLAAVILPMVMDEEPRQPVQGVQIRIPGQDQLQFDPKELAARSAPPAAAVGEEHDGMAPGGVAAAKGAASGSIDQLAAAAPPATKPIDKAPEGSAEKQAAEKKAAEQAAEKKVAEKKAAEKKAAEKKAAEKKAAEKTAAEKRAAEKSAAEKKAGRPADKPVEAPAAADAGRAVEAPPARSDGQQVILIGAFADPENVKKLLSKIGKVGVPTYTEALNSPDGTRTRVRAGPFPNREAAEKALEKLKGIGVGGVVAGKP
ncbi:SPOR domain-containing protein [Accumulibacter sp.]|uniref:SPOR domain-containing protein n=1 Tax=Accumulibacter sp. TaxID=2053492 RepID=UPI002605F92D|nr:SPOR domain-containing protein [Accumulibacter sp.]